MLLCAIVACNSDEELLIIHDLVNEEEEITLADSVALTSISPGNWDGVPDEWFEVYGEPISGTIPSDGKHNESVYQL